MDHKRVQATIEMVKKAYSKILEEPSSQILDDAKTEVNSTWLSYTRGETETWGYKITPRRPIKFRISPVGKLKLHVDLFCSIQWDDHDVPKNQDIKIRVWSTHKGMIFRQGIDDPALEAKIAASKYGRVMSRLHFDRVDHSKGQRISNQYHPHYHFQIGGGEIADGDELCWYPDSLDIPRIPHYPLELFLACQIVAANFFPDFYEALQRKAEWKQELIMYQKLLVEPYFDKSLRILKANMVLLDELKKSLSED